MITEARLGAYAWIERDGMVLLTLWQGAPERGIEPHWGLPGGGVEWNEQIHEATIREVREETGFDVEPAELLGVTVIHLTPDDRIAPGDGPLRLVRFLSRATITGGQLTDEVGGSTLRAAWFSRGELAALPTEQVLDWALGLVDTGPTPGLPTPTR